MRPRGIPHCHPHQRNWWFRFERKLSARPVREILPKKLAFGHAEDREFEDVDKLRTLGQSTVDIRNATAVGIPAKL